MNNADDTGRLRMHSNYERLTEVARESHARGRALSGVSKTDISQARLYCHAYRGQVIGAFSATRRALSAIRVEDRLAAAQLLRANELLADLANRSMVAVGDDVRALVSTFHYYSTNVARAIEALDAACQLESTAELQRIRNLFRNRMSAIAGCNSLHITRDDAAPEQGSFVVPNLGITIVPLVYGDHHSWNLAWLDGARSDVPYHLHREGVEIHLGYSPVHGYTVLGGAKAEILEGYAMPIPPNTRHGYTNIGNRMHHVPFIFGSFTRGGWGIFLDVEPQTSTLEELKTAPMDSEMLKGTIFVEREISKIMENQFTIRYPLIRAENTERDGIGGLELSIALVTSAGIEMRADQFCAVSVVRGRGVLTMANEQVEIASHDHFGIPANMTASVARIGSEPLVLLDSVLRSADRHV